jgi:hypothetical protein
MTGLNCCSRYAGALHQESFELESFFVSSGTHGACNKRRDTRADLPHDEILRKTFLPSRMLPEKLMLSIS